MKIKLILIMTAACLANYQTSKSGDIPSDSAKYHQQEYVDKLFTEPEKPKTKHEIWYDKIHAAWAKSKHKKTPNHILGYISNHAASAK